jgi:Zn-dependent metalloprotease
MIKRFVYLVFLFPSLLFAQQFQSVLVDAQKQLHYLDSQIPSMSLLSATIPIADSRIEDAILLHFKQIHPSLQDDNTSLILVYNKTSKLGNHLLYQQTYKGIPIYKATLKVNTNHQNRVISSIDMLQQTSNWQAYKVISNTTLGDAIWITNENNPIPAFQLNKSDYRLITDAQGTIIEQKENKFYYTIEDTMVSSKVFLPDPLTSQSVIYGEGGTYKHFNDSDYALLNNERKDVLFPATISGGVFKLENKYAKIMDLISPNSAPSTSLTPNFNYTRSQNGFKETMVMYHLYASQLYYQFLGFDELKDFQIKADAIASTNDNSSFNLNDSTLFFGTGGVPDAEDGDVISHEYTHALSYFMSPAPNMNSERRAIEEAICDVVAANLSKQYTPFNWRLLYNFDGPNPVASGSISFWGGRNGNSTKTYANYTGNPYSDCEIWSSTILDIAEQIGNDTAAMILLNAMYMMGENTTMPQAASLMMQVDSILFNRDFGWKIGPIFNARGLGNFATALPEEQRLLNQLVIYNTASFAIGTGNTSFELPVTASITILDMQGKTVKKETVQKGIVSFNPNDFVTGIYIVRVQTEKGLLTFKLVRN